ncbi:MAG: hypothetical protein JNM76_14765 [Betaproteobacteria bacterium]|nr:hypothetical protein [Betaproteobacteria bacterium]
MDSYIDWLALVAILGTFFFVLGWIARGGWDAIQMVRLFGRSQWPSKKVIVIDNPGRTTPDTSPLITPRERGDDTQPIKIKALK